MEKRRGWKVKVNFKVYDVINWEMNIIIHALPKISRSKGNNTMKFGHVIEYNIRNIFLEKSNTKCGGETSLRPFSKKSKLAYLGMSSLKFYTVCIYCVSRSRATKVY